MSDDKPVVGVITQLADREEFARFAAAQVNDLQADVTALKRALWKARGFISKSMTAEPNPELVAVLAEIDAALKY